MVVSASCRSDLIAPVRPPDTREFVLEVSVAPLSLLHYLLSVIFFLLHATTHEPP